MPTRFQIVAKAKLRKKLNAERAKKKAKRPRVPWKWSAQDSTTSSFKGNVGDVVSEKVTFKEYLINEAKYYRHKEKEKHDWQDDIDDGGVGVGVCPKCGWLARYESLSNDRGSYWVCQNDDCMFEEEQ